MKGMARRTKGYRFGRSVADNGYALFVQILTRQGAKRRCAVAAPWLRADRLTLEQDVLGLWCSENQAGPVQAQVHLHDLRSESGP